MEPTIYKPSIYNGAGVYNNGAGDGIYKGRGVYNDGPGGYNGPFVLLNNFESLEDNVILSEIGPDFTPQLNYNIVPSNIFTGKNCLFLNSPSSRAYFNDNITTENIFTCESFFSNYEGLAYNSVVNVSFGDITIEAWGNNGQFRVQCKCHSYNLYNGAYYITYAGGDYYLDIPIQINTQTHFAIVVLYNEAYIFFNGVLFIKLQKNDNYPVTFITGIYNETINLAKIGVNFVSVRNGDFSNNLMSFDVPTQKYHL